MGSCIAMRGIWGINELSIDLSIDPLDVRCDGQIFSHEGAQVCDTWDPAVLLQEEALYISTLGE